MTNDYVESTLLAPFISSILKTAPKINFDILTPGDINLQDMENGLIDLAINRFTFLPKSFHQSRIWNDNFCCLTHKNNPYNNHTDFETYLEGEHIWINRSGWGADNAVINKSGSHKLGWVDEALWQFDKTRNIRVFTRHYMMTQSLLAHSNLIATIPRRQAMMFNQHPDLVTLKVPFQIVPIEIKMIWSPLLHHSKAHQWLRRSLADFSKTIKDR